MKTCLVVYVFTIICQLGLFSQNVPNGGFEEWELNTYQAYEPAGWETQNETGLYYIEKATGHSGSYSAKLSIVWDNVIKSFTGASLSTEENFTVTSRYQTLSGFYKGNSNDTDTLKITVRMYSKDKPVGFGSCFIANANKEWKQFILQIEYNSDEIPDKASISIFIATEGDNHYQAVYYIDDLLLTSIIKYVYGDVGNFALRTNDKTEYKNKIQILIT